MAVVMEIDERVLTAKFGTILPHLDERQRRLVLAAEAQGPWVMAGYHWWLGLPGCRG
jgi:hypothetical protein